MLQGIALLWKLDSVRLENFLICSSSTCSDPLSGLQPRDDFFIHIWHFGLEFCTLPPQPHLPSVLLYCLHNLGSPWSDSDSVRNVPVITTSAIS
jgi:hypothetical protein